MKIIFGHLDIAYNSLSNLTREIPESFEIDEEPISSIYFPSVKLPYPLNIGELVFRRNNDFYSAYFGFSSKKSFVFRNLSKRLDIRLKKLGMGWSPMDKNGCGYVLDNNKMPIISITDTDIPKEREIWLGSSGGISRKFEEWENFYRDLKKLEEITNITIEACLSSPTIMPKKRVKSLPKHPIYVNS